MMKPEVEVSVVISTWNRCAILPGAIESLLAQQSDPASYEIIIVDNNSTDSTRQVVESLIAQHPQRLRYVFEPRQGLSFGRNAGLMAARGAFVAYTDDDVRVAPDWVWQIREAFARFPRADFIGGRVLPRWPHEPPAWLSKEYGHWGPLALTDYGAEPFATSRERPICLVGASLIFRRDVLRRAGGFRPELQLVGAGTGSMEDHELQLQLYRAGHQGWYVPELVVYAEVQRERMMKSYHRRWHSGHGRFSALIRLEESFTSDGRLLDAPLSASTWFGAPKYLYRQLLNATGRWLKAAWRRNESAAFAHELQMRELFSYISERRKTGAVHENVRQAGSLSRAS